MLITVGTDGNMRVLDLPEAKPFIDMGERVTRKRASHVVPVNVVLRGFFKLLRWATGETGRISDWTRTWRCSRLGWQSDLSPSGGPTLGPFISRDEAIVAEIDWLEANR